MDGSLPLHLTLQDRESESHAERSAPIDSCYKTSSDSFIFFRAAKVPSHGPFD